LEVRKPIAKQFSLQKLKLEVDTEINQIESAAGDEQVYVTTSADLYSFKHDGSGLHKILSSTEGLDQFAVSTSGKQLIYVSNDEFHICNKEGKAIKTIPVEDENVLNAINFSLFPSEDKIVFVGESAEPGPAGPEIPVYRICLLDLKTGKASPLSKGFYSTIPKLMGWRGEDVVILNEDSGDFLLLSTKNQSEELLALDFSSVYKEGVVESVAVSQDGKRVAFSVAYPIDRVQIFIKETWKSRMIYELEGEGGVSRALLWSPNSQWISYINSWFSSLTLYLIPVTSEKPEALEASSLGLDSKVAWLPKGDGLAYSDGKEIRILKSNDLIAR
jgi:Tol biopolymer transport system component